MNEPAIRFRPDFDAWWPDYDHAPETCFSFVKRGLPDIDATARLCRQRKICVQAGAHAGFWPRRLAGLFRTVYAFECEPALYECARRNLKRWRIGNVVLSQHALGAAIGASRMVPHRSAGSWTVDPQHGSVPITMTTIDALGLKGCDAILLDVEGWEIPALEGAARTIAEHRPIIHLEELPDKKASLRAHMQLLGYRLVATAHKDAVYKPEEQS